MKQIKLNRPHVHAGVSYAAGEVIEVTDADAVYLIRHQIGVKSAVKKSDKSDKPTQSEQPAATEQQPGDTAENTPSADGETENQNQGEQ
ncbi:DUF7210 family protein [Aggregatibacter kilianii]|uniref:DUF7210 family protein n=1 Tax=Aggregatibacter kilianii TaxID=2025884 RepID=UPI000D64D1AE|nr:hypothetical protein [Aggregatibacter kilianii]